MIILTSVITHTHTHTHTAPTKKPEPAKPAPAPVVAPIAAAAAAAPSGPPKIRHEWFQTESHVIVSVYAKGVKKEDATISINDKNVRAFVNVPRRSD